MKSNDAGLETGKASVAQPQVSEPAIAHDGRHGRLYGISGGS